VKVRIKPAKLMTISAARFAKDSAPKPVMGEVKYSNISHPNIKNEARITAWDLFNFFPLLERYSITNAKIAIIIITKEIIFTVALSMKKRRGRNIIPRYSIIFKNLFERIKAKITPKSRCAMLHNVNNPSSI